MFLNGGADGERGTRTSSLELGLDFSLGSLVLFRWKEGGISLLRVTGRRFLKRGDFMDFEYVYYHGYELNDNNPKYVTFSLSVVEKRASPITSYDLLLPSSHMHSRLVSADNFKLLFPEVKDYCNAEFNKHYCKYKELTFQALVYTSEDLSNFDEYECDTMCQGEWSRMFERTSNSALECDQEACTTPQPSDCHIHKRGRTVHYEYIDESDDNLYSDSWKGGMFERTSNSALECDQEACTTPQPTPPPNDFRKDLFNFDESERDTTWQTEWAKMFKTWSNSALGCDQEACTKPLPSDCNIHKGRGTVLYEYSDESDDNLYSDSWKGGANAILQPARNPSYSPIRAAPRPPRQTACAVSTASTNPFDNARRTEIVELD